MAPNRLEAAAPSAYQRTSSCDTVALSAACARPGSARIVRRSGKGPTMRKLLALLIGCVVICSAAIAQNTPAPNPPAQNTTDPDQVVAQLKLWTKTDADPIPDPVYYGEMTDWNGGHMACLEVAFIKYETGVLHYSFKMWAKHDGSCEYTDQTTRKVDNSPTCVADSEKPNPRAATTTLLTKKNIDVAHSVFRTMDFPNRRAGQLL